MTNTQTCGERFQAVMTDLRDRLYDSSLMPLGQRDTGLLCAGFIAGQAEKCFLGACRLCIFRSAPPWDLFMQKVLEVVCSNYEGLASFYQPIRGEYWLYRLEWQCEVKKAAAMEYPSADAHYLRGRLCGIPTERIDVSYDLRTGHDQPCEPLRANGEDVAAWPAKEEAHD